MDRDREPRCWAETVDAISQSQELLYRMKASQLRDAGLTRRSHSVLIAALLTLHNGPMGVRALDL